MTPNNHCGECPVWLAIELDNFDELSEKHCKKCFAAQYVVHIPTGCCYPLEPEGKTVIICGAHLTPKIDGKVFWRYSDVFVEKIVKPSDPFANH